MSVIQNQSGLHSAFWDSHGYTERPCGLERNFKSINQMQENKIKSNIYPHNVSSLQLIMGIYILPGHNANETISAQTPKSSQQSSSMFLSASSSAGMNHLLVILSYILYPVLYTV